MKLFDDGNEGSDVRVIDDENENTEKVRK